MQIKALVCGISALTLAAVSSSPAAAWSESGHRIVGELAYKHLSAKAKKAIDDIVATDGQVGESECPIHSLSDAAYFPDCVKLPKHGLVAKYQYMRNWHFENHSNCGAVLQATDYCAKGICVTEAIKRADA